MSNTTLIRFTWLQDAPGSALTGWVIGFIVVVGLILFFAWLLSRSRKGQDMPNPIQQDLIGGSPIPNTGQVSDEPVAVADVVEETPHNRGVIKDLTHPENDDFTVIEGIGPAMQEILYDTGITTYDKLAQADPVILKDMLIDIRLQNVDPTDWPEQARLAADGQWDQLEEMKSQRPQRPD